MLACSDCLRISTYHLENCSNSFRGVRSNPYIVSSRWYDPSHASVVRAEVVGVDCKENGLLLPRRESDALEPFQLPHRTRGRCYSIMNVKLHHLCPAPMAGIFDIPLNAKHAIGRDGRGQHS